MLEQGAVHVADRHEGHVQRCRRCRRVLVDNRGIAWIHGDGPHYFIPGAHVRSDEWGFVLTNEAPTCGGRKSDGGADG